MPVDVNNLVAAIQNVEQDVSFIPPKLRLITTDVQNLGDERNLAVVALAEARQQIAAKDQEIAALKARIEELEAQLPPPVPTTPPVTQPPTPPVNYVHNEKFDIHPKDRFFPGTTEQYYILQTKTSDGLTIQTENGKKFLRVKVRSDEPVDEGGRTRREGIRRRKKGTDSFLLEPIQALRWFALSVRLGGAAGTWRRQANLSLEEWKIVKDWKDTWFQLHPASNAGGPVIDFHTRGEFIKFIRRTFNGMPDAPVNAAPNMVEEKILPLDSMKPGTWHRVVVATVFDHRAISSGGKGLLQVWLDGTQIVNVKQPVGYNDPKGGPYASCGEDYPTGWAENFNPPPGYSSIIDFDDVRFGDASNKYEDFV